MIEGVVGLCVYMEPCSNVQLPNTKYFAMDLLVCTIQLGRRSMRSIPI